MKVLPWKSAVTVYKRLRDEQYRSIFNPIMESVQGRTFTHVKGENIIKFLELTANGQLNINDQKQNGSEEGSNPSNV